VYYLDRNPARHRRFTLALLAALAVHAAVILGVTFEAPDPAGVSARIEVTLATRPSQERPEEARFRAAANQVGSGDVQARERPAPPSSSPPPPLGELAQRPRRANHSVSRAALDSRVASRSPSDRSAPRENRLRTESASGLQGISPELDQLAVQMSELQTRLVEQHQSYSNIPRVRRLTSVSTLRSEDAAYLQAWRERVEAVGNRYYPEASVRYGIYGSLRLLVAVRSDGGLDEVRILSSSGYDMLDEAAIKIVRMAAPFSPFPPELAATADRLEIIRTWQFQQNRLSSG
jgi:protein TonB